MITVINKVPMLYEIATFDCPKCFSTLECPLERLHKVDNNKYNFHYPVCKESPGYEGRYRVVDAAGLKVRMSNDNEG